MDQLKRYITKEDYDHITSAFLKLAAFMPDLPKKYEENTTFTTLLEQAFITRESLEQKYVSIMF